MAVNFIERFNYFSVAEPSSSGGSSFPTESWAFDLNGDSRDDLIFFTPWTLTLYNQLTVLFAGEFEFSETLWNGDEANAMIFPRNMSVADFNGDGLLDMALFMAGNNELGAETSEKNKILINQGNGSFEVFEHAFIYHGSEGSSHGGSVADIDGDGDIDIIPTQYGPPYYWLENITNTQTGVFDYEERTDSFMAINRQSDRDEPSNYHFADFDNDGIQDFIIGWGSWSYQDNRPELNVFFGEVGGDHLYGDSTIVDLYSGLVYVGDELEELDAIHGVQNYGQSDSVLEVFDFDRDGDLDLFSVSNITPMDSPDGLGWDGLQIEGKELFLWRNSYINVYENLGNREFIDVTDQLIPNQDAIRSLSYQAGYPKQIYFEDLNGDGQSDILLKTENGSEWANWSAPESLQYPFIYLRDGDQFVPISKDEARPIWGEAAEQLIAGDFNGDGVTDIVGRVVEDPEFGRDENGAPLGQPDQFYLKFYENLAAPIDSVESLRYQGTQLDNILTGSSADEFFSPGFGKDQVFGEGGRDTLLYWGNRAEYTLSARNEIVLVVSTETDDQLTSVERLQFTDTSIALDLEGNAGTVAKILGSVFGVDAISNDVYAGIGLDYLDNQGYSPEQLMDLALRASGAQTNADVVDTLYYNIVNQDIYPTSDQAAPFVAMLEGDNPMHTWGSLGMWAANLDLNLTNIDFVGLQSSGLEYTPVG